MTQLTFLDWTFYGNTLSLWTFALLVTMMLTIVLRLSQRLIIRQLTAVAEKTTTAIDDYAVDIVKQTHFLFWLILSLYIGSLVLALPEQVTRQLWQVVVIALFVQTAIWGNGLISGWVTRNERRTMAEDSGRAMGIVALGFIAKLVLWLVILLLILDNLGVEITALIAGLGIGGIAIGLPIQNILGDLFASLSIVLDKPFEVGDFIIVDTYVGTVERVGLKTTRVRSVNGEQLVFSNGDLLQSRIQNYKRMAERRIIFSVGVVYGTPPEKLTAIPVMVQEIVEGQEQTRFDRAHFKAFGDFALNFEVVYYVLDQDYKLCMDIQQAINLALYRRFQEAGIEFAFPTQTLHLDGQMAAVLADEKRIAQSVN
jgi:small-conductance mechanosensitive channel